MTARLGEIDACPQNQFARVHTGEANVCKPTSTTDVPPRRRITKDMNPMRWPRLSPLLDIVPDRDECEQARRLAMLRRRDPTLADEVASLLASARYAQDEAFLEVMQPYWVDVDTGEIGRKSWRGPSCGLEGFRLARRMGVTLCLHFESDASRTRAGRIAAKQRTAGPKAAGRDRQLMAVSASSTWSPRAAVGLHGNQDASPLPSQVANSPSRP